MDSAQTKQQELLSGLVHTASPNLFFWQIQIDFRKVWTAKKKKNKKHEMRLLQIQDTFGVGLKCNSNWISIEASQLGCSDMI